MISILIVGTGKVGTHLYDAFSRTDKVDVLLISSRDLVDIPNADITIITAATDTNFLDTVFLMTTFS